mmetsp:Transcript_19185/g.38829  ORF Transcript_19185/g.38829 Transcript_19185/m.38829 type:complete len:715 (-) Transcript_19185:257-2401(-)
MNNLLAFALCIGYTVSVATSLKQQQQRQRYLRAVPSEATTSQTSTLWGNEGELWDSSNSALRDFTNVGYELSNEPIPDWPIYKNVTDYGALPDDDESDVEAFRLAIADCPDYHAIGVPNGRYIIDEGIDFTKNFVILRGESRDNTILFFPKHMNEIQGTRTTKNDTPFITFFEGEHRGIENLSLILRDEQKGTGYWQDHDCVKECALHWYYSGETMIEMRKEQNSWMRDIYIKNANHAIKIVGLGTTQISVINVVLDQFIDRKVGKDGDGHMGVKVGDGATHVLVHNLWITGTWAHDLAIMGTKNSVFSRIKGENVELDHHARNYAGSNLYTEVDTGIGGRGYGGASNNQDETYWGIKGIREATYLPSRSRSTLVGIHTSEPTSIGAYWHHETIDPDSLSPLNIWTAQMTYMNKYVPDDKTLTLPPPLPWVRRLLPTEDAYTRDRSNFTNYGYNPSMVISSRQYNAYLKYDLSGVDFDQSSKATLKIWVERVKKIFGVQLFEVADPSSWFESTLVAGTKPTTGDIIPFDCYPTCDAIYIDPADHTPGYVELDITAHVNKFLGGQDKIMSLLIIGGGALDRGTIMSFPSKESGNPPQLVIHEFYDTVPPPHQPMDLTATSGASHITVDWADNDDDDLASYNVYRHDDTTDVFKLEAMGLTSSEYTDYVVWEGVTYTYVVTAVDIAGTESIVSQSVSAALSTVVTIVLPPSEEPPT